MYDFSLTEEQELLLESTREFCQRNAPEAAVREWIKNFKVSDEFNKAFYDAGFAMFGVPEEYGGTDIDLVTQAMFMAEFIRNVGCNMPSPLLVLYDILAFGTEEQKARFLEIYKTKGTCDVGLAVSEPSSGSDNMGMTTVSHKVGDKIIINGSKTFCSGARNCRELIVLAKDEDPSRENTSITMWLVPVHAPGVKIVDVTEIGFRTNPFSDVYFDDVEIDESHMFGQRGKGFLNLMKNFEMERVMIAAQSWGLAMAAMDEAAAYASQRKTFETPIGNYQLIQKRLVDMQVGIDNIRNYVLETAWKLQKGISVRTESALLKYYATRTAFEVCDNAMAIFAGIAYTADSKISRLWADARGNCFAGGTEEIMVHIAGRQLVKKYSKGN